MSKGPGKIERAIAAAFAGSPDGIFLVEDLVRIAYPGSNMVERRHRVAVLRAARNVCRRLGWDSYIWDFAPSNWVIFFNKRSVRSYALARLTADQWYFDDRAAARAAAEAELASPRIAKLIQKGGIWWCFVEHWTAELDGDTERAATLAAEVKAYQDAVDERLFGTPA